MSNRLSQIKFVKPYSPYIIESLSDLERELYLSELWPIPSDSKEIAERDGDFDHYFENLEILRRGNISILAMGRLNQENSDCTHSITTFDDLFFIIKVLQSHPLLEKEHIFAKVRDSRPDLAPSIQKLTITIELALHLWLMYDLQWTTNSSLSTVLADHFSLHQCDQTATFSTTFNLYDMKRIAGFEVVWTYNLDLHLALVESRIFIFQGVSVLFRMLQSGSTSPFLEPEFIEETLATIKLLASITDVSHHDRRTMRSDLAVARIKRNEWLADEVKRHMLDHNIARHDFLPRHLNYASCRKSRYPYWQNRLLAIEDAFEKAKPRSFRQWWHDTRDMQQWWGFWLVITGLFLTVLFGLIQSITGIIQVARSNN
ncbi:hypothetical protein F5Y08DRAFT_351137 [Xylaria arbuscula]|nr:hypothetical protein F5Y08DRAFT_351137 [Xylaria arbuscula]